MYLIPKSLDLTITDFFVKPMLSARKRKDGRKQIQIFLFHNPTKTKSYINVGIHLHEEHWSGVVKNTHLHHKMINEKISTICELIEAHWRSKTNQNAIKVKTLYDKGKIKVRQEQE